jgi:hypothetical protein
VQEIEDTVGEHHASPCCITPRARGNPIHHLACRVQRRQNVLSTWGVMRTSRT